MADRDDRLDRPSRRRFMRQAIGRRPVTLSCAQLYIRYLDAVGSGRPDCFAASVRREVAAATDVILTDCEWLSREDFARALTATLASNSVTRRYPTLQP